MGFLAYILLLKLDGSSYGTFRAIWLSLLLTLLLFEFHVPVMHHGSCELVDRNSLLRSEAQDFNGTLSGGMRGQKLGQKTLTYLGEFMLYLNHTCSKLLLSFPHIVDFLKKLHV